MNAEASHVLAMYVLPAAWIGMSLMSATVTLPVLHLRRRLLDAALEATGNTQETMIGISIALDDLRGAQMRFAVQICFIILGVLALGVFPVLPSRIAITVLFFAANALMGAKSVLDFRGLSRALELAQMRHGDGS